MQPTTKLEKEIEQEINALGINSNLTKRWENGAHHPKAEDLARQIGAMDWLYGGDALGLKFGGDGDNGEHLIFLLDLVFELQDKKSLA